MACGILTPIPVLSGYRAKPLAHCARQITTLNQNALYLVKYYLRIIYLHMGEVELACGVS